MTRRPSGTDDVVMDTSSPAADQAVITRCAWSSLPPASGSSKSRQARTSMRFRPARSAISSSGMPLKSDTGPVSARTRPDGWSADTGAPCNRGVAGIPPSGDTDPGTRSAPARSAAGRSPETASDSPMVDISVRPSLGIAVTSTWPECTGTPAAKPGRIRPARCSSASGDALPSPSG